MPETYTLDLECSNCDWRGPKQIPKGNYYSNEKCEVCGLSTLSRDYRIIKWEKMFKK